MLRFFPVLLVLLCWACSCEGRAESGIEFRKILSTNLLLLADQVERELYRVTGEEIAAHSAVMDAQPISLVRDQFDPELAYMMSNGVGRVFRLIQQPQTNAWVITVPSGLYAAVGGTRLIPAGVYAFTNYLAGCPLSTNTLGIYQADVPGVVPPVRIILERSASYENNELRLYVFAVDGGAQNSFYGNETPPVYPETVMDAIGFPEYGQAVVSWQTSYVVTNWVGTVAMLDQIPDTNGFVRADITNGLATVELVEASTNGLLDAGALVGLATVAQVEAATNGLLDAAAFARLLQGALVAGSVDRVYAPGDNSRWIDGTGGVWKVQGSVAGVTNVTFSEGFRSATGMTPPQVSYALPFTDGDWSGYFDGEANEFVVQYLGEGATAWYGDYVEGWPVVASCYGFPEYGTASADVTDGVSTSRVDGVIFASAWPALTAGFAQADALGGHTNAAGLHVTEADQARWNTTNLQSRSFVLANPTSGGGSPLWRVPAAITVANIHVLCVSGTSVVGNFWEYDANGANGSNVDGDITALAGVSTDDDGALSNPVIALGNYLGWKTTAVNGAVSRVILTIDYR